MIHHYTSINSLAGILSSGRLRFTRLDKFDDVLEAQNVAGIDFGSQLFGSCWVKQEEEDIAQWRMYGDDMEGVRVSFPDDPFEWNLLNADYQVPGTDAKWYFDNAEAPFTLDEVFGDGYLLQPVVTGRASFLKQVIYVDDVADAYRRHVYIDGEAIVIQGHHAELARYKWNKWQFQREHRFVLAAIRGPLKTDNHQEYGRRYSELVRDPQWPKQGALASYIDLRVAAYAFADLIVTTGPLSSPDSKAAVKMLLKEHAPYAKIISSELEGKIRARP